MRLVFEKVPADGQCMCVSALYVCMFPSFMRALIVSVFVRLSYVLIGDVLSCSMIERRDDDLFANTSTVSDFGVGALQVHG